MIKNYRITYDSEKEDAFVLHKDGREIKFKRSTNGLYYYKPSENYKNPIKEAATSNFISTVEEYKMGYTQRQFERAKAARKLYHNVGTPTVENFKALIRMNTIANCPVTVEDITIAEKNFGPDISSLKGKSTRTRLKAVISDTVEIPVTEILENHHEVSLCIDTMFVNGITFLTSIDKTIKYRTLSYVSRRTAQEYYEATSTAFSGYTTKRDSL